MFDFGIALLILGALTVVAEIHSFTVYLIVVAAACFVAGGLAVAAHTGLDLTLIAFGLVLLAGLPVAHVARRRLHNPESDRVSRDDVGAEVRLVSIDNGSFRVSYRGAEWDARPATGFSPEGLNPGARLTVVARDGSTLIVAGGGVSSAGA